MEYNLIPVIVELVLATTRELLLSRRNFGAEKFDAAPFLRRHRRRPRGEVVWVLAFGVVLWVHGNVSCEPRPSNTRTMNDGRNPQQVAI